jgi:toxin ParE1/3/4
MRKIRLRARAESDLIDIWVYSFQEWDDLQADKYVDELNAAISSLVRKKGAFDAIA